MNRKKKTALSVLWKLIALTLSVCLLYSCEDDAVDADPVNKKLVKETYYYGEAASPVQGFTSYLYNSRGSLILKNVNDITKTRYEYDSKNRLVLESTPRGAGFVENVFFSYPSALQKVETRIINPGDTLNQTSYLFDDAGKLVQENYFAAAPSYYGNTGFLRLTSEKEYQYYGNGLLKRSVQKNYRYWQNEISEIHFFEEHYDHYGNKLKYIMREEGASQIYENKFINTYNEKGLLTESYMEESKKYSYTRFVYDEQNRKIKTYDFNNYLTGEWFYKGNYLVEKHAYTPDNYDDIPDFKTITLYTYE